MSLRTWCGWWRRWWPECCYCEDQKPGVNIGNKIGAWPVSPNGIFGTWLWWWCGSASHDGIVYYKWYIMHVWSNDDDNILQKVKHKQAHGSYSFLRSQLFRKEKSTKVWSLIHISQNPIIVKAPPLLLVYKPKENRVHRKDGLLLYLSYKRSFHGICSVFLGRSCARIQRCTRPWCSPFYCTIL